MKWGRPHCGGAPRGRGNNTPPPPPPPHWGSGHNTKSIRRRVQDPRARSADRALGTAAVATTLGFVGLRLVSQRSASCGTPRTAVPAARLVGAGPCPRATAAAVLAVANPVGRRAGESKGLHPGGDVSEGGVLEEQALLHRSWTDSGSWGSRSEATALLSSHRSPPPEATAKKGSYSPRGRGPTEH
jgi:hypothetical protein